MVKFDFHDNITKKVNLYYLVKINDFLEVYLRAMNEEMDNACEKNLKAS